MSLEYSMFRFSDDYPTADGLSEIMMQVCMDDDSGDSDHAERLIAALVEATYQLRYMEAADEDENGKADVAVADNAPKLFMTVYAKACKALGEPCDEGDAWWEEWWPTAIRWHPDDIARLAKLKAGETRAIRRQLRAKLQKHRETSNAQD